MKTMKLFICVVLFIMSVVMVMCVAGCGGDTGDPKDSGDDDDNSPSCQDEGTCPADDDDDTVDDDDDDTTDDDDTSTDDDDDTVDDDDDSTDDDDDTTDDDDSVDWKQDFMWIEGSWSCKVGTLEDAVYDPFYCPAPTVDVEIDDWDEENQQAIFSSTYFKKTDDPKIFKSLSEGATPPTKGAWGTLNSETKIWEEDWVDAVAQETIHFVFHKME